jgi:hypothetical protein
LRKPYLTKAERKQRWIDSQVLAQWLLENIPAVDNRERAENIAHTLTHLPAYDRTRPIQRLRLCGTVFSVPAVATIAH